MDTFARGAAATFGHQRATDDTQLAHWGPVTKCIAPVQSVMPSEPERRRYYPDDDSLPLSQVVREAIVAHEDASLSADELALYDHINPDAIDLLFQETAEVDISVTIQLENVTVGIWSDGGVDVRVTEKLA